MRKPGFAHRATRKGFHPAYALEEASSRRRVAFRVTKPDGNSPTSEGLEFASLQVMDGYRRESIPELLQQLVTLFGSDLEEASFDSDSTQEYRSGAYLQGPMHRRAWRIDWQKVPWKRSGLSDGEHLQLRQVEAHFVLQWADYLPFAVAVVWMPIPDTWHPSYAAEELFELLPGRLAHLHYLPASRAERIFCVKISETRMKGILDGLAKNNGAAVKSGLAGAFDVDSLPGRLRLRSPYSNMLFVEGEGSMLAADDRAMAEPFWALLYSGGNQGLGFRTGWEWHLPMWLPPGLAPTVWHEFNFRPFLLASTRNARTIVIEAGKTDETLTDLAEKSDAAVGQHHSAKQLQTLHHQLTAIHATVQKLRSRLHLGATRSPLRPAEKGWQEPIIGVVEDTSDWPFPGEERASPQSVKEAAEKEADEVLKGLEARVDRALELVGADNAWQAARSTRRWAIINSFLAAAAIAASWLR